MTKFTIMKSKDASLITEKTELARESKNYLGRILNWPKQNELL